MVLRFSILAAAFLLSCTGIERDSVCDEKSIKYNGCAGGVSPSSNSNPSSSSIAIVKSTFEDVRDNRTYEIVKIGNQTWMAENLDYDVSGSRCYSDSISNCATYGRLYDWATAMNLPSDCNSTNCSLQINMRHRGVCFYGWHMPSNAEWTELTNFAGDDAGTKLKAQIGWNSYGGVPGSDIYGFSALPGGSSEFGGFYGVGEYGNWWSSSEFESYSVYSRSLFYSDKNAAYDYNDKSSLNSVRCVRDD